MTYNVFGGTLNLAQSILTLVAFWQFNSVICVSHFLLFAEHAKPLHNIVISPLWNCEIIKQLLMPNSC